MDDDFYLMRYFDEVPEGVECKYCGEEGLVWEDFGSGPKLYTQDGVRHVCQHAAPSADDFDAV